MTFFVDANVIVYAAHANPFTEACLEIIDAVADRKVDGKTSPAVLEEVWFVELRRRVGEIGGATRRTQTAFAPLLVVTEDIFWRALGLDTPSLGANDRVHLATCLSNGIDTIVSIDTGFDRVPLIRRVDPRDDTARRRLLAAG